MSLAAGFLDISEPTSWRELLALAEADSRPPARRQWCANRPAAPCDVGLILRTGINFYKCVLSSYETLHVVGRNVHKYTQYTWPYLSLVCLFMCGARTVNVVAARGGLVRTFSAKCIKRRLGMPPPTASLGVWGGSGAARARFVKGWFENWELVDCSIVLNMRAVWLWFSVTLRLLNMRVKNT